MASKNVAPPVLPPPTAQIDPRYMAEFIRILNLFFRQITTAGPVNVASQNVGATSIIAGLSFSSPTQTGASIPTQADLANLRSGDVYCDTSASYVLKVKP